MIPDTHIKLNRKWKFHTGDNNAWKSPDYNDAGWKSILYPRPGRMKVIITMTAMHGIELNSGGRRISFTEICTSHWAR